MKSESQILIERLLGRLRFSPTQPDGAESGGVSLNVTVWSHETGSRFDALFDAHDVISSRPIGSGIRLAVQGAAEEFQGELDRSGQAWFCDLPSDEYSVRLVEFPEAVLEDWHSTATSVSETLAVALAPEEWAAAGAPRSLPGAPNFKLTLLKEPCVFAEATEMPDATARLWIWTGDTNAVGRMLKVKAGGEANEVLLAALGEKNAVALDLNVRFDSLDEEPPVCELSPRRTIVILDALTQKRDKEELHASCRSIGAVDSESLAAASDPELPTGRADAQIPIPSDSDLRVELRNYGGVAWLFSLSYEGGDTRLAGGTIHYAVGAEKGSFVLLADGGDKARGAARLAQPFSEAEKAEISIEFVPRAK